MIRRVACSADLPPKIFQTIVFFLYKVEDMIEEFKY